MAINTRRLELPTAARLLAAVGFVCAAGYLLLGATRPAASRASSAAHAGSGSTDDAPLAERDTFELAEQAVIAPRQARAAREQGAPREESSSDTPIPGAAGGISASDLARSIRVLAEDSYAFDADVVRAILAQGGSAVRGVVLRQVDESGVAIEGHAGFFHYLGLRPGDVLVSARGAPLHDLDDLVDAFLYAEVGVRLELQLVRAGRASALSYRVEQPAALEE